MRRWAKTGPWLLPAFLLVAWHGGSSNARAEDATSWKEIETKYIFGFTTGSGIGLEGEKEVTVDTIGRFGKRDGHYAATETKYEFEFTPTQFIQIEFGALGSTHDIGGVTGLDAPYEDPEAPDLHVAGYEQEPAEVAQRIAELLVGERALVPAAVFVT